MRFHRRYPFLQTWLARSGSDALLCAENLAIARFEPTVQSGGGGGVVDLLFSDGNRIAAVPFLEVTPMMLLEPERTPIVWPEAARALLPSVLNALEAQVVPWLQSMTLAGQLNAEVIRAFPGTLPEGVFDAARAASLLGAAPYTPVLLDCAPYVYAMRFARGNRVHIADPRGASGAALLVSAAQAVRADLQSGEADALARRWFDADVFGELDNAEADVAIYASEIRAPRASNRIALDACPSGAYEVRIAHPVPTDVSISFEPDDSFQARSFGITAPAEPALRERTDGVAAAAGGSSGRILLIVRENAELVPDADVEEAHALGERLASEGFTVRICGPATVAREDEAADLVHVFTLHHAAGMADAVSRYAARGVPVVATACLPLILNDTAATPYLLRSDLAAGDEGALLDRLDLLDLHARKADLTQTIPSEGYAAAIRSLLTHVNAVLVNAEPEEQLIRQTYGYAGPVLQAHPLAARAQSERIAHLTGTLDFAFVHAPLEARTNIPLLARAFAERGIPLVAAGPAFDPEVRRTAGEILGGSFIHIPAPSPGELEGLYRSARLYVDLSWLPSGLSRIARAIACGARVLVSERSHARSIWPSLAAAAPGSISSIRNALGTAWEAPAAQASAPSQPAFLSIIAAYDQAQRSAART